MKPSQFALLFFLTLLTFDLAAQEPDTLRGTLSSPFSWDFRDWEFDGFHDMDESEIQGMKDTMKVFYHRIKEVDPGLADSLKRTFEAQIRQA